MEYHKMNNMMNEEMNEENNQNMIYYSFDKELTHIINKEGEFYAFNPTTSINIVDKNDKLIQIYKLKLSTQDDNCIINIGNIKFDCVLLTRSTDNKVLLRVGYYDNENNKHVYDEQKTRLSKYIESLLLGFSKYGKEYEENPYDFFERNIENNENNW